jgi:hypothetical protein
MIPGEDLPKAVEGEDPKRLRAKGLPGSVRMLRHADAAPPPEDPIDLPSHPLGLRQVPGFSGMSVDRQEANDTQGIGPEIPVPGGPHALIPNPTQSVQD